MRPRAFVALMFGLLALGAVVVARRASAAPAARPAGTLDPLTVPFDELRVTAPPLVIAPPPRIEPVRDLGALLGGAVDQIKDALKGLGLWSKKVPAQYRELFAMAGSQYRLPPGLLEAVAYRESRFRDDIIRGEVRSSAGAVGIMQVVPRWHPELGEAGALDPLRAVPYAAKYLRALFEQFGTWKLALAAYNWGPGNLKAARGGNWPAETVAYVGEISVNAGLA